MTPETHIGKYTLYELIGEGATSEVFRARDEQLGREVAFKLLKPALIFDRTSFQRFVHEARAASDLFHTHIATVLDVGEENGRFFLVMRYIPGQSLEQILKEEGPLAWPQALKLVEQIGSALDYAHQKGLLHRDVKPSNIRCTPEGNFVLVDFGLARAFESAGFTNISGAILGTPPYIPPEVWEDQQWTAQSDQYALACVFVEAVSGQKVFSGSTPSAIITRHVLGRPVFPERWPAQAPQELSAILQRALARIPSERFASSAQFFEALRAKDPAPAPQPPLRVTLPDPPAPVPAPQPGTTPEIAAPRPFSLNLKIAGLAMLALLVIVLSILFINGSLLPPATATATPTPRATATSSPSPVPPTPDYNRTAQAIAELTVNAATPVVLTATERPKTATPNLPTPTRTPTATPSATPTATREPGGGYLDALSIVHNGNGHFTLSWNNYTYDVMYILVYVTYTKTNETVFQTGLATNATSVSFQGQCGTSYSVSITAVNRDNSFSGNALWQNFSCQ